MLVIILVALWCAVGGGSILALCIFRWGEITLEDCFMVVFGACLGPLMALIAIAYAGADVVLWRRK